MFGLKTLKKLAACILCIGVIGSPIAGGATADGKFYMNDDFNTSLSEIESQGWIVTQSGGSVSAVDGSIRITANGQTATQSMKYNVALPLHYVATFRVKANNLEGNGRFQPIIYANGTRVFLQIYATKIQLRNESGFQSISKSTEMGAWYTYTYCVNNGVASVYRQKDTEATAEVLFKDFALQSQSGAYLNFGVEGGGTSDVEFDDVKIWTGMAAADVTFTTDGMETTDFAADGVLQASANIYYCDNDNEGDLDTTLMMIVFNRNGRIVDMGVAKNTAKKDSMTEVSVSVDLSGKNCSGGSAELYLWDSISNMCPLTDAIILQ